MMRGRRDTPITLDQEAVHTMSRGYSPRSFRFSDHHIDSSPPRGPKERINVFHCSDGRNAPLAQPVTPASYACSSCRTPPQSPPRAPRLIPHAGCTMITPSSPSVSHHGRQQYPLGGAVVNQRKIANMKASLTSSYRLMTDAPSCSYIN